MYSLSCFLSMPASSRGQQEEAVLSKEITRGYCCGVQEREANFKVPCSTIYPPRI